MRYRDITVTSRVDGEVEPAKLFECDQCGKAEFIVYMIKGHPHLQCTNCDTTFCQGDCSGADKLQLSKQ